MLSHFSEDVLLEPKLFLSVITSGTWTIPSPCHIILVLILSLYVCVWEFETLAVGKNKSGNRQTFFCLCDFVKQINLSFLVSKTDGKYSLFPHPAILLIFSPPHLSPFFLYSNLTDSDNNLWLMWSMVSNWFRFLPLLYPLEMIPIKPSAVF